MRSRAVAATLTALVLFATACSGDDDSSDPTPTDPSGTSEPSGDEPTTADETNPAIEVVAGEPFPEARCEANRAAGTISYLTGFDFAATASIVDVLVAGHNGYFDELCLDVEITPSFSTANYPLVAANDLRPMQMPQCGVVEAVEYGRRHHARITDCERAF